MAQNPFLYLRALRNVDFTVFAVADGQKRYFDDHYGREIPYASGQQVKRSLIESMMAQLGESMSPVEFRWKLDKTDKKRAKEDIALQTLDPSYPDQLIGGYMKATNETGEEKETDSKKKKEAQESVVKRRSPLSISALRPLHPLLSTMIREKVMTYDRRSDVNSTVSLMNEKGVKMSEVDMKKWIEDTGKGLTKSKYLGDSRRASGLFVYDIAIDLRRLFTVSLDPADPELKRGLADELRSKGWVESQNAFGPCLVCPSKRREEIIPALAHALINWDITSNQARTYHPREILAVAISQNANQIVNAIRADLDDTGDSSKMRAVPRVDKEVGAQVFVAPVASGKGLGVEGSGKALDEAEASIRKILESFSYETSNAK